MQMSILLYYWANKMMMMMMMMMMNHQFMSLTSHRGSVFPFHQPVSFRNCGAQHVLYDGLFLKRSS